MSGRSGACSSRCCQGVVHSRQPIRCPTRLPPFSRGRWAGPRCPRRHQPACVACSSGAFAKTCDAGCPTSLKRGSHSKRARRIRSPHPRPLDPLSAGQWSPSSHLPRWRWAQARPRGAAGAPGGTDHDPIRDPGASRLRQLGNLPRTMEIGDPISPDGRTVAFVAAVAGPTMIRVRPLDASTSRALPSTEGAGRPFWSPDSRSLAFFAGSQLKRIALAGGLPTVLTDEPGRDVAWSADGVMLIGGGNRPLRRLPASGGVPTPVTALAPGELTHDYPQFLPDGQHFVYLSRRGPTVEDWDVFVGSLDSKERQRLDGIHGAVRYVSGHLMFTQGETLLAQRFNLKRLALDGDPEPVADGIAAGPRPLFDVSPNGTLVYLRAVQAADSQLAWIDRSGRTVTPFSAAGAYSRVALSDDGRYLAFERNFDVILLTTTSPAMPRATSSSATVRTSLQFSRLTAHGSPSREVPRAATRSTTPITAICTNARSGRPSERPSCTAMRPARRRRTVEWRVCSLYVP